jgi:hypothetical protein
MGAMMEDSLGGGRPTPRFRLSIAWAGVRERAYQSGVLGASSSPADRARAGSLIVLCAWAAAVVAGANFAKLAEHYDSAMPVGSRSRSLARAAFVTIEVAGVVAAGLVAIGALAALPAFVRFVRNGGWPHIRRHVISAAVLTAVAMAGTGGLFAWSRSLSNAQRNGADFPYGVAFLAWAFVSAGALVLWTSAAVAAARRLDLARRVLAMEAAAATVVAVALVAITAATALWWAAVASAIPWWLQGAGPGTPSSPFDLRIALTMALLLAATVAASYGVTRIAGSRRELRAA